jgi:hypothetical protein
MRWLSSFLIFLPCLACGRPKLTAWDAGDVDGEGETSGGESSWTTSSSSESSTADSTDETSTNTDSTETRGFFVPEFDVSEQSECDVLMQDCPDGEKCAPYSSSGGGWDASKCVPVLGDQPPGEPCIYAGAVESTDDCDATSFCWDVNQEGEGICHAFCTGTPDTPECPEGSSCLISSDSSIFLCIYNCDPTLQDCSEGLACYWASGGFNCIFTTQDIPPGEPCGFINDCVAGTSCLTAEVLPNCVGSACCSPWCQLGAGDLTCEVLPGTMCVSFFEDNMAPPGFEHVGVCIVPP